ncbi:MAG: alpha/beta hydrolase [Candidatus Aminicenantes bacterium]|nr:alpha/beta hydrolase [Candidatus Aminicenantes bacterium]
MKNQKDNVFFMGQGAPVVLLHSAMSSKLQWYFLMRLLSSDFLTVALDFYGSGGTPLPDINSEVFSLSDEIALVDSLLDGIVPAGEPFHLVGHSYGGAVGLRLCYKNEKQIRSLTLFEPVAYHLLPETEEVLAEIRRTSGTVKDYIAQNNYAGAAEYFIDYWNGSGTFATYPKEMQEILCRGAGKMPLSYHALMEEPLSLEDYKKINVPVCLIAGRQSPLASRRVAELLVDILPNCRLHWLDTGHMAPLTHPHKVNPIIETFIRQVESTK